MKIVHVTPYYPPHLGGMENTVRELAERTAEMGHEVVVYASNKIDNKPKLSSKENRQIHYLNSIEIGHTPIMPSLPFRLIRDINKDTIVHIHYAIAYSSEVATIISKIKEAKIVSHIHIDPLPSGSLGFLLPTYKKLLWRRPLSLSNVVICPTKDYIDIVSQKYNVKREKCVIVPYGINTTRFKNIKTSVNISTPAKILFVGRLSKQKNVPRLLESFRLLQQKYDAILHIVGDGEEKPMIEYTIKKEKINNVILHGTIPNEKIGELYLQCDIFVLPSSYESFGIVNLEAMASGLPIVASDIPGIRKVLKDSGILVKPTAENFADAIVKLIENANLRKKLVTKGRKKVKDCDWDKITKRVLDVYGGII